MQLLIPAWDTRFWYECPYIAHLSLPAQKLQDFHVTLSDMRPPIVEGTILESHDFRPCGAYNGVPPAAQFTTLECTEQNSIGRYLYLYRPVHDYLTVCEVEVFGLGEFLYITLDVLNLIFKTWKLICVFIIFLHLTHWLLGDLKILDKEFSSWFLWLMAGISLVKLLSDACHWTILLISEFWFSCWLGAIRQQAITWASVDPDLFTVWCH